MALKPPAGTSALQGREDVRVSPRGRARHDVRIKVHQAHGNSMDPSNTAVVAVRPAPHLIAGSLGAADQHAVFAWVSLNQDALIAYWDGQIDTAQLIQQLRRIP